MPIRKLIFLALTSGQASRPCNRRLTSGVNSPSRIGQQSRRDVAIAGARMQDDAAGLEGGRALRTQRLEQIGQAVEQPVGLPQIGGTIHDGARHVGNR